MICQHLGKSVLANARPFAFPTSTYTPRSLTTPLAVSLLRSSFAGLLRGEEIADWGEDEVYSEREETRVIQIAQWAFFKRYARQDAPDQEDELFNVAIDPDEKTNLAADPGHPHIVAELSDCIETFFARHA